MAVIARLDSIYELLALLIYGSGLRVMEAVRLRIQDVDFENGCIIGRESQGGNWRRILLAVSKVGWFKNQINFVLALHQQDLDQSISANALAKKYPNAGKSPAWQYLCPAKSLSVDPRSRVMRRHHIGEKPVQRHVADKGLNQFPTRATPRFVEIHQAIAHHQAVA